jgi:protein subunit release factor B
MLYHVKLPSIDLREEDVEEKFVKGSGNGGQKINKVRNNVFLKHIPTGLFVQCQKTRSLDDNRRIARKLLIQKLDDHINGVNSKKNLKIEKQKKKKARKKAKSRQKYLGERSADLAIDDQAYHSRCIDEDNSDDTEGNEWDGTDDDYGDDYITTSVQSDPVPLNKRP